jgi:hypothetical protein
MLIKKLIKSNVYVLPIDLIKITCIIAAQFCRVICVANELLEAIVLILISQSDLMNLMGTLAKLLVFNLLVIDVYTNT